MVDLALTIAGLGGLPDDLEVWDRWLSPIDQNDLRWIFVIVAVLASLSIELWWRRRQRTVRQTPSDTTTSLLQQPIASESKPSESRDLFPTYKSGADETGYRGPKLSIKKSAKGLIDPIIDLTDHEAKGYADSKIGCWLPVVGSVRNIFEQYDKFYLYFDAELGGPYIVCEFTGNAAATLAHLSRGDEAAVIGKVKSLSSIQIKLEECELFVGHWDDEKIRSVMPPTPDTSEAESVRGEGAGRPRAREGHEELIRQWRAMLAEAEEAYQQGRSFVAVLIRNAHWSALKAKMKPEAVRKVKQAETELFGVTDVQRRAFGAPRAALASTVEEEISRLERKWGLTEDG